jgi:hypothetical protein
MPSDEIDDDDIVDRLGRIFKYMPAYALPRARVLRRASTERGQ